MSNPDEEVLLCKDQHQCTAKWIAAGPGATALQLVVMHRSLCQTTEPQPMPLLHQSAQAEGVL